ncbi:ATP-dependent helicase [Planobispora rosea]|uniref:ATP-dependent helicase n=1 Tax=Planobispora rosea TaxID=35762 RepID=A0A8J3S5V4_PLARO|nr:ATP-dependent helicase HrpB [Planobispora rosea]GGS94219.1 ATP-dependent helicase [Planobispora rosea]GIH87344.1 ATP-dependent helicase [Planobispora rosea]
MRSEWSGLPVRHVLPELAAALDEYGVAVLTAPPGTGKTTLLPLALAGLLDGPPTRKAIVAEPRRMAVRAAARRMAWLLESRVGAEVGFSVRGERRAGPDTIVEVVTTGVLLQRLQRDPELGGVDVVLLDECHERHLDADTALAFLLDVRATLRPDLRLLATSATADAAPWARLLGTGEDATAPIIHASGTLHPVTAIWAPPPRPTAPPHGLRVDPAFLSHVADVVRRALAERHGDVLCFLPGVGEIGRVAGMLAGLDPGGVQILQVHGQAPAHVQDAVLSPGRTRRVILATSVAESSLTVPGVRVVVDSGLAREPRTDHARGLGSLTTVRVSRASAEQRAGRAGREAPGTVYRCWSRAEHDRLPEYSRPEIALADLTGFALQAACWGDPAATGLALLDPPPPAAMAAARRTLHALGALRPRAASTGPDTRAGAGQPGDPELSDAVVTDRGRRMSAVGVHPRLARALIDLGPRAAEVVALLSEQLPRDAGDDLVAIWRSARRGGDGFSARWRREAERLARAAPREDGSPAPARHTDPAGTRTIGPIATRNDDHLAGMVVALAYPERVARRRGGAYLMASGTAAELPPGSRLGTAEWLAVAVADRPTGSATARITQAVVIDEEIARLAAAPLYGSGDEITWRIPPGQRQGDVSARRVERLGAIELSSSPLRDADVRPAVLAGLRTEGLSVLRWSPEAAALRERLAFCRRALGEPWHPVDDDSLVGAADLWLEPELSRARRRSDLERIDVAAALLRLVPWSARLEETAPERIEVPSGSRIRIDYSGERPVLAAKLQELFGWDEAPSVAGVPLVVHLLSPAGRPAAVTGDLASFWREGYRAVRAELRGRYPKHPWPEDPLSAVATRRTDPRR